MPRFSSSQFSPFESTQQISPQLNCGIYKMFVRFIARNWYPTMNITLTLWMITSLYIIPDEVRFDF